MHDLALRLTSNSHNSNRAADSSSAATTPTKNEVSSPFSFTEELNKMTLSRENDSDSVKVDGDNVSTGNNGGAYVGYRTEWCHAVTGRVVHSESRKAMEVDDKPVKLEEGPIFDVVTKRIAKNTEKATGASTEATTAPIAEVKHSIRIYSTAIINALRRIVEYYPGQDLSGDPLELQWPYPILVHHYDKLVEFKTHREGRDPETLCVREHDAAEHLGVLIRFLDDDIMKTVREEQILNQQGRYTFDKLWLSYKPGSTVLVKHINDDYHVGYVVQSVSGGSFVSPPARWEIRGWKLQYDGAFIGRWGWVTTIERADGPVVFSDGITFIDDWDDNTDNEIVRDLINWGSIYWSHLKNKCSYHKGISTTFPHTEVRLRACHKGKVQ